MALVALAFAEEESPDSRTRGEHRASVTIWVAPGETIKLLDILHLFVGLPILFLKEGIPHLLRLAIFTLMELFPIMVIMSQALDRSLSKTESGLRVARFYKNLCMLKAFCVPAEFLLCKKIWVRNIMVKINQRRRYVRVL